MFSPKSFLMRKRQNANLIQFVILNSDTAERKRSTWQVDPIFVFMLGITKGHVGLLHWDNDDAGGIM